MTNYIDYANNLKRALEITLGVPKCYKLSSMPGFIYNLYRSQPARMTLSVVIFYCVVSYLAKMVLKYRDCASYT